MLASLQSLSLNVFPLHVSAFLRGDTPSCLSVVIHTAGVTIKVGYVKAHKSCSMNIPCLSYFARVSSHPTQRISLSVCLYELDYVIWLRTVYLFCNEHLGLRVGPKARAHLFCAPKHRKHPWSEMGSQHFLHLWTIHVSMMSPSSSLNKVQIPYFLSRISMIQVEPVSPVLLGASFTYPSFRAQCDSNED